MEIDIWIKTTGFTLMQLTHHYDKNERDRDIIVLICEWNFYLKIELLEMLLKKYPLWKKKYKYFILSRIYYSVKTYIKISIWQFLLNGTTQ